MTKPTNFLDFLSDNHKLPSFNLPTDAVSFVARSLAPNGDEQIEFNMSNGLEKALTQYSPGKEIIVKKKTYMSGGIYLGFPPRHTAEYLDNLDELDRNNLKIDSVINRLSLWFEQVEEDEDSNILSWHHRCNTITCQHTLESTSPKTSTPESELLCKMCNTGVFKSIPMLRPPGFAPLVDARNGSILDVSKRINTEYRITTKWPTQIIGEIGVDPIRFGEHLELRLMTKKKLININPGKGEIEEDDGFGFTFCKKCGALNHDDLPSEHQRPYAIPFLDFTYCGITGNGDEKLRARKYFDEKRTKKCTHNSNQEDTTIIDGGNLYRRIVLGRTFETDVLVFRVPWNTDDFVDMDPLQGNTNTAQISALTLLRSLLEGITGDTSMGLNISESDIDGDIRRYRKDDEEGWELYVFERSDGGIGLLKALFNTLQRKHHEFDIENPHDFPIIGRALDRLSGKNCTTQVPGEDGNYFTVRERPCKHICSGCLLDYSTQYMEKNLDRTSGYHFLLYALYGEYFQDRLGSTMSDDHRNLHSLIGGTPGGEEVRIVYGNKEIGHLDDGIKDNIDLRSIASVILGDEYYSVCSPLLSEVNDNSFSRDDLLNNPQKIIKSLQNSGVVNSLQEDYLGG